MVEWLFLAEPWGWLRFLIVVFSDHTHLLFLESLSYSFAILHDQESWNYLTRILLYSMIRNDGIIQLQFCYATWSGFWNHLQIYYVPWSGFWNHLTTVLFMFHDHKFGLIQLQFSMYIYLWYSCKKWVWPGRKCHNHTLQTNLQHRDEKANNANSHMISSRQENESNQLSPPQLMIKIQKQHKILHNKQGLNKPHPTNDGSKNKQWINKMRTTTLEWTATEANGRLKLILLAKSSP